MLRSFFNWVSGARRLRSKAEIERFSDAISIDVSGPEFFDFYPTAEAIAARLRGSGQFHEDAIGWMAETARAYIADGGHTRGAVDRIVQSGTLQGRDAVSALGFYRTKKVGNRYVTAIAGNDASAATDRLQHEIHVACSHASHMHNLRRMFEMGVGEVTFSSANDERSTALERKLEGTRMTIEEARDLATEHADEISRSVFRAIINF